MMIWWKNRKHGGLWQAVFGLFSETIKPVAGGDPPLVVIQAAIDRTPTIRTRIQRTPTIQAAIERTPTIRAPRESF